jgi:hypothetical protein
MHNLDTVVDGPSHPGIEGTSAPASLAELAALVEHYIGNLQDQAAILMGLSGPTELENQAEAGAYLAAAGDLSRILTGELTLDGLTTSS